MQEYLLGVDVGTSGTKGVIVDRDGRIFALATKTHKTSQPKPGYFEHDADAIWWADFCQVARELLKESKISPAEIAAVGCSGLGADMLPVDSSGTPIRPAILYGIDTRAVKQQEELSKRLQDAGREDITLTTGSIGPKILWLRQNEPAAFARLHMVATASTYLVYKLTGVWTLDKYTASAFTPMIDPDTWQWNEELCQGIVDPSYLPEIRWARDIAGEVTNVASRQTGLAKRTPVIVGTCDASAEAVSVGVSSVGNIMIMYGTTAFFVGCSSKPVVGPGVSAMPYVVPGSYAYAAGTAAAGGSTEWFVNNFAIDLAVQHAGKMTEVYSSLAEKAAEVPAGSEGLTYLPYLSGERSPINDPDACGLLFGLHLFHDRRHVYRSILEGVGFSIRHCLETIQQAGGSLKHVVAVGGGTKNKLWVQLVSDILGLAQHVPKETVGASYGDAYLAGLGIGLYSSLEDIKSKWIESERMVTPDRDKKDRYDELYSIYLELYSRTQDLMHRLSSLRKERS